MAEGNERALAHEEIERKRGERENEHARAQRQEIGLGAEMRDERKQRQAREEHDCRR